MPPVNSVFHSGSPTTPVATIRALHSELAAVGMPVVGTEAAGMPPFETATESRVRGFQQRIRLPDTGNLDPETGGVMSLASLVATERMRATLEIVGAANGLITIVNWNN
jgi:hypothetical protein